MLREVLSDNIKSQAKYVEVGYGQVEPNHLSAQYNGQIYAQLPANPDIKVLEQGQFVKYDYAHNPDGEVNFTGAGEWMLVYNEIKLYREGQLDCEFAMIKDNYQARVYSPLDGLKAQEMYGPTRFLQGKRESWNGASFDDNSGSDSIHKLGQALTEKGQDNYLDGDYSVATKAYDYYEMDDVNNPAIKEETRKRLFMKLRDYEEKMMPKGTAMVPRVFKTMPGDIFTTNTINSTEVALGDILIVGDNGILAKTDDTTNSAGPIEASANPDPKVNKYATAAAGDMKWQVVKVYTMPDMQKGVKVMRIQ